MINNDSSVFDCGNQGHVTLISMAFVFRRVEKNGMEQIPHATFELYEHTVVKGAQAGAILPMMFSPPILYALNRKITWNEVLLRTAKYSLRGSVRNYYSNNWTTINLPSFFQMIGALMLVPLTYARIYDQTEEQIFDRSYRIRYNKGQVRCDRISVTTAGIGAVAGAMAFSSVGMVTGGLYGASLGLGLGVFVHIAISQII